MKHRAIGDYFIEENHSRSGHRVYEVWQQTVTHEQAITAFHTREEAEDYVRGKNNV